MDNAKFAPILDFYRRKRRMPTYAEIARLRGFKSKNSAYKLAQSMIEQGYAERDSRGKLIPTEEFVTAGEQLKLLGAVEAGFPSPAEEELTDTMTLDEYLVGKNREATYMLKVSGDSMRDAGIMPGDMVLVERRTDAREGDIVIAEVDHEWTMKFFRKRGEKVVLVPGNKRYPVIEPTDELKIAAIVKAVLRKY